MYLEVSYESNESDRLGRGERFQWSMTRHTTPNEGKKSRRPRDRDKRQGQDKRCHIRNMSRKEIAERLRSRDRDKERHTDTDTHSQTESIGR